MDDHNRCAAMARMTVQVLGSNQASPKVVADCLAVNTSRRYAISTSIAVHKRTPRATSAASHTSLRHAHMLHRNQVAQQGIIIPRPQHKGPQALLTTAMTAAGPSLNAPERAACLHPRGRQGSQGTHKQFIRFGSLRQSPSEDNHQLRQVA